VPDKSSDECAMNVSPSFQYAYSTISIRYFDALLADIDKLDRDGKLSTNTVYRKYLNHAKFQIPESTTDFQSVIIVAVPGSPMLVNFHFKGAKHEIMLPPNYYDDGLTEEDLCRTIQNDVIQTPGYSIERAKHVYLKLLAVRSGLGRYGRNNICYVEGMGSLPALYAFFTDFRFKSDNWLEIKMMDMCEECEACIRQCPTGCLSKADFVIDAGKCLTLYNEIKGEFPGWIDPQAHNALMGCMKCQQCCPANRGVLRRSGRIAEVTEKETESILNESLDDETANSLSDKLRMFSPEDAHHFLPILARNLRVLLFR